MWVRQIQMPPTKNHSTFMNMLRQLGCDSFHFTFEPKQAEWNGDDGYHQNQSSDEILNGSMQSAKDQPNDVA
jgi:hypothetical protein